MWFVYTYIMYGDSDNDECSTNECANAPLWMMLCKAFSTLSFRQFYDDTKANPVKMPDNRFARFILKMSKYVANPFDFDFEGDADFLANISRAVLCIDFSIVMRGEGETLGDGKSLHAFETFWERSQSLAIANGKIKQSMYRTLPKKPRERNPRFRFSQRWLQDERNPKRSIATKWC